MNTWQITKQLKYLLEADTWPDSPNEKVLSCCIVTAGMTSEMWSDIRRPFAMLQVGNASSDRENPDLMSQSLTLVLVASVYGDHHGETALTGGPRGGGQGSSKGRGLLEIEEEALETVRRVTGANGVNIIVRKDSAAQAVMLESMEYVVYRTYSLDCLVSRARYYHPPRNLAKSGSTVSWALPPDRFDRYKIVLNRKSGSTAPSSATDGTATSVTLATDLATSVTDATTGTWTYAVWAAYDETHTGTPASAQRYSSATVGTTLTVT